MLSGAAPEPLPLIDFRTRQISIRRTGAQAAHHTPLCGSFSGSTVESPTARRLFYWDAKLKALEASFDGDPMDMLWLIQELKSSELNMPSVTSAFH